MRQRRELARAADLPRHVLQKRRDLFGFEFIRDCPARELLRNAQRLARCEVNDLHHRAVDHIVQLAARFFDLGNGRQHARLVRGAQLAVAHRELVLAQKVHHFVLRAERTPLDIVHVIEIRVQMPQTRHLGIKLAQRARRGVARVLERLGSGAVVFFQRRKLHIAFTVHLHQPLIGHGQRNGANRQRLRQDGFAGHAVSARGGLHQLSFLIGKAQREPVELVLHHIGKRRQVRAALIGLRAQLLRAVHPVGNRAGRLRLVHAQKAHDVRVRRKLLQRLAAYAPRGRIRQNLAGFLFQTNQLVVQAVVLHVRHRRVVQHVVFVAKAVQDVHQFTHAIHRRSPYPILIMGASPAKVFTPLPSPKSTVTRAPPAVCATCFTTPLPNALWNTRSPAA